MRPVDLHEAWEMKQHTIKTLREKILILENALADKEKIIKLLEKQLTDLSS